MTLNMSGRLNLNCTAMGGELLIHVNLRRHLLAKMDTILTFRVWSRK